MFKSKYTDLIDIKANSTVIIGLSGGPDSVFLLSLLAQVKHEKGLTLMAAHLDHEWRAGSVHDAEWCQALCDSLDIPLIIARASDITLIQKPSGSKEDLGRQLRRQFFEQLVQEYSADAIALGHHAGDQEETFFIRLIRGATLTGLTGIKKQDGIYWRPLLNLSKQEILEQLEQEEISYLEDPSNHSADFLRNRIRQAIVPALKECDSRFEKNFTRTLSNIQESEQFLQELTKQACLSVIDTELKLDVQELKAYKAFMQKRILVHWLCESNVPFTISATFIDEIIRFLSHDRGGCHEIHPQWGIEKKKHLASIFYRTQTATTDLEPERSQPEA